MHQITQHTITFTTIKPSPSPPPPTSKILNTQVKLPKTHFPKLVISSKWGRKRSGSRARTSQNKKLINSIAAVASHFKILPDPFDSLLREYLIFNNNGGNGNGGGIVKFGSGGGGGGKRRKGRMWVWVTGVVMSALGMWVVMESESGSGRRESGVKVGKWVMGVLGVCSVVMGRKMWREIGVWVLGFCCGVAAVVVAGSNGNGGGLKGGDFDRFLKMVDEMKGSFPGFVVGGRKKRSSLAAVRRWL